MAWLVALRLAEHVGHHLGQRVDALERLVLLYQTAYLVVAEPVLLSLGHLLLQLGVELAVVQGVLEVDDVGHLHADEAARAGGVGEGFLLVGGAYERGVASVLLVGLAVGWAELHVGRRQQVFQEHLLAGGGLVELVDVDERKRGEAEVQVGLVLEVDTVVVVVAQFLGQQDAAEAGLAAALTAYEQRHQGITRQRLLALPVGHHAEQPCVEVQLPVGLAVGHPCCQGGHAVLSVPCRQMVKPVVHGVVLLYAGRLNEACNIPVPRLQSQFLGSHRHLVACLVVQVGEVVVLAVVQPVLCHAGHHVLAHLVVGVQEDVGLHHQQRVLRHALQRLHLVAPGPVLHVLHGIDIGEGGLHQQAVVVQHGVQQRELQAYLLRDALRQTVLGHPHHQLGLAFLVGQLEVVSQHVGQHKLVVEYPCALHRTARHQVVVGRRPVCCHCRRGVFRCTGCRLVALRQVYIERYSVLTVFQVRVGTDVHRPGYQRLQGVERQVELGAVSLACRMVELFVEALHLLLVLWHAAAVVWQPFAAAHHLHRAARCAEERQQRLGQTGGLVAQGDGLVVRRQVAGLKHQQTVVGLHRLLLLLLHQLSREAQPGQRHLEVDVRDELSVVRLLGVHQVPHLAQLSHFGQIGSFSHLPHHRLQVFPHQRLLVSLTFEY